MSFKFQIDADGESKTLSFPKSIVTIGRARENDVCVDDTRVSRYHLAITRTSAGQIIIRDLGSQNGTFVAERRVYRASIEPDEPIRLGRVKINSLVWQTRTRAARAEWQQQVTFAKESGVYQLPTVQEGFSVVPDVTTRIEPNQALVQFVQSMTIDQPQFWSHADVLANLLRFAFALVQAEIGHVLVEDNRAMKPRLAMNLGDGRAADASKDHKLSLAIDINGQPRYRLELILAGSLKHLKPDTRSALDCAVRLCEIILENLSHRGVQYEVIGDFEGTCLWDSELVTNNRAMQQLMATVSKVSEAGEDLLILGETGTGKEVLARFAHSQTDRAKQLFIPMNCASLPDTLVESLFNGMGKKVATGVDLYKGYFEQANDGVLFLDEIGDMPLAQQVSLLRILQSKKVSPIGQIGKEIDINPTCYFATNKDLVTLVREGNFREDLFHRLPAMVVTVPPLRDRREDIPLLANYFLDQSKAVAHGFTRQAMDKLLAYDWPGNVRQLHRVVKRAGILCSGKLILDEHVLFEDIDTSGADWTQSTALTDMERVHISRILDMTGGNKTRAAELLGITRPTLLKKIKDYELK